ncbi:MAG: toxin-antitoxin system YwqK family antitoxin [Bacteroidota bacterium]
MRFNKFGWLWLLLWWPVCSTCLNVTGSPVPTPHSLPEELPTVGWQELELKPGEGRWYVADTLYAGTAEKYNAAGRCVEEVSFVGGKKNGANLKFFADGRLSYAATYDGGKREGLSASWWINGNLRSRSRFAAGKAHGVQEQWYENGQPFKRFQLNQGKEEGLQQAWRRNGKLFINYEARNGRIFGLKRANLCYELSNEQVTYQE